ncbi:MAG: hypothetical protein ACRDG3_04660 [Tepidiformaceae bacterium]
MSARSFFAPLLLLTALFLIGACDRGSAGVLVTQAPGQNLTATTSAPSATRAFGLAATPMPTTAAAGAHTWYTSSSKSAKDYYCDLDSGWQRIVANNLRSYKSESELLAEWGAERVKQPGSKC